MLENVLEISQILLDEFKAGKLYFWNHTHILNNTCYLAVNRW